MLGFWGTNEWRAYKNNGDWKQTPVSACSLDSPITVNTSHNCFRQLFARDQSHTQSHFLREKDTTCELSLLNLVQQARAGACISKCFPGFHLQIKMCIATGWLTVVSAWREIKADWSETQRRTRQSKETIGQLCQRSVRVHLMCFAWGTLKAVVCCFTLHSFVYL